MKNIVIESINLAGIHFTTDFLYEKRKVYKLNLTAILPNNVIEVNLKIVIIDMKKNNNGYSCRTMYRHLSENQCSALSEIIENLNNNILTQSKLFANILT